MPNSEATKRTEDNKLENLGSILSSDKSDESNRVQISNEPDKPTAVQALSNELNKPTHWVPVANELDKPTLNPVLAANELDKPTLNPVLSANELDKPTIVPASKLDKPTPNRVLAAFEPDKPVQNVILIPNEPPILIPAQISNELDEPTVVPALSNELDKPTLVPALSNELNKPKPDRIPESIRTLETQTEISLKGDFAKFTPEAKAAAIRALASLLNISEKEILILDVEEGSIIIKIVLPTEAAYKLMELYETGTPIVIDLGNQEVEVNEVRNSIMLDVESLKRQLLQRLKNLSFFEEQAALHPVARLPLDLHTQIEKEKEAIEVLKDKIQTWEIEVDRPQMPSHHAPTSLWNTTSLPTVSLNP